MLEVILYVLAGLGIAVIALFTIGVIRLRGLHRRHGERLQAAGVVHATPATLFGRASDRQQQRPGPGTLGLAPDRLIFVPFAPTSEFEIALDELTSVTKDQQFMGRQASTPLLIITWDQLGLGDAAAIAVQNVDDWIERLAS